MAKKGSFVKGEKRIDLSARMLSATYHPPTCKLSLDSPLIHTKLRSPIYLRFGSPEWRTVLPMAIAAIERYGGEGVYFGPFPVIA